MIQPHKGLPVQEVEPWIWRAQGLRHTIKRTLLGSNQVALWNAVGLGTISRCELLFSRVNHIGQMIRTVAQFIFWEPPPSVVGSWVGHITVLRSVGVWGRAILGSDRPISSGSVVRPPKSTPTIFSGSGPGALRVYIYIYSRKTAGRMP